MGKFTVTIQAPEGDSKEFPDESKAEGGELVGAGMRSGGRRRSFKRKRYSRKGMGMRRRISKKRRRGYGLASGGRFRVKSYRRRGGIVRGHIRRRRR